MKKHYIYLTTDHLHNKKYIGKHYGELNDNYYGSGNIIKNVITKYGTSILSKEILYISQTEEENNIKEKEYISLYNAVDSDEFYNISAGGDGGDIFHSLPLWQQEQIREENRQRFSGKNNPRYGVHLSKETKDKIRKNRDVSYMQTDEYRQKMSIAVSGEKNGMYGKKHTEESKRKMSENSKGKTIGEKNGMYGKKGDLALNGKKIAMLDENYNVIRIFNAKTAVLEFLNLKGHSGLDKAIKNNTLYKGYYWRNYLSVETNTKE
jgi:group I intron endonuclease